MRAPIHPHAASLASRPDWRGHGAALLCVAGAFTAQGLLQALLAPTPFLLPLAGVLLAARDGGRGPGWLAAVVSALLAQAALTGTPGAPHPVGALLFIAVGGLAATLVGRRDAEAPPPARVPWPGAEGTLAAALLRGTGDAMLITDAYGVVLYLNPVAARLLGRTEVEVVGRPVAQVLHLLRADTRELVLPAVSRLLGSGAWDADAEPARLLLQRDGAELLVEERALPLLGSRGKPLGAVLVLRDASGRHHLEQQHVVLVAPRARRPPRGPGPARAHGVAVPAGPGDARRLPRAGPPLRAAQSPRPGAHQRPGTRHRQAPARRATGPQHRIAAPHRRRVPHRCPLLRARGAPVARPWPEGGALAGYSRYFDLTWQPWRGADGAIQGVMAVAVEVTGQVNARRAAEVLAQEAQEALRTRDEFLSIASHELKTPITSLQLQLEMLLRSVLRASTEAEGTTVSDVRRRVEATLRPVARLHQLVSTLLDVSRIRAGRLELEQDLVDLSALVQELAARVREDASSARCPLRVEVDGALVGRWDRLRLEQVITNLLSNAFKYGARQPVVVRVTREKDFARLTVTDHGIGIAPEDHERIFQRFERAVSERHYGGFGLGLWIVRQILDSLGGDIQVRSQPGEGSTFIVRLPLDPAASAVA